jgi:S-adenosylmethionine:tRNA ribosyltransferase-isomerase
METALFDYHLPVDRIAQRPVDRRDHSRLMRLDRASGAIEDHHFSDLPRLLRPGDLLVMNDTRVLPARLALRRVTGSRIEGLFLRAFPDGCWDMMLRGRGRIVPGETLIVEGDDQHKVTLVDSLGEGLWRVRVKPEVDARQLLDCVDRAPLPPYIQRKEADATIDCEDRRRYQTVFAEQAGAVAAPTAGLHFTTELLDRLSARDIRTACLTLHVGLGTFKPVASERVEDHRMHSERFHLPAETAAAVRRARAEGRRVVAVGTTTVRVLESVAAAGGFRETEGETALFIYPPYEFRAVDALITNFHLPKSSLLMLVAALAGREFMMRAYGEAINRGYRFYSYGDACLIE